MWDSEALVEVATSYLDTIHPTLLNKIDTQIISTSMVRVHEESMKFAESYYSKTKNRVYVTPPMFMSFM